MRAGFCCLVGIAGAIALAAAPQPAAAQEVNRIVGALNAILNPQDALRLEERARREGRGEEERYWRDYRAGLEHRSDYDRPGGGIGADEARRLEDQARRNRRYEDERYWRDYRAGLERRPDAGEDPDAPRYGEGERRGAAADPEETRRLDEQARRYEERSRRNHRTAEERYWRDYRAGLEGRARE